MRIHRVLAALLLVLLTLGTSAARRPAGLGTVGGQVLDTRNKPVVDARVTVQASDGRGLQTTETDARGHFWFPFLSEGQYSVRAYGRGGVSEWRQNVWVSPGRQTNVILHLGSKKAM